jgi:hypothetical protein
LTTTEICASPQRRRRFKLIAAAIYKDERHKSGRKISSLMVIRDVKHRWNFTEAMISRAVVLRKVNLNSTLLNVIAYFPTGN